MSWMTFVVQVLLAMPKLIETIVTMKLSLTEHNDKVAKAIEDLKKAKSEEERKRATADIARNV